MATDDWSGRLAYTIASEMRKYRHQRGMSVQQLSDACSALGLPIARSVLANFEARRRPTVSVAEVLVIARALRVAPALLLFPVGDPTVNEVEFLPGETAGPWEALKWFTGEGRIPIDNLVPRGTVEDGIAEWYEDPEESWKEEALALYLYRAHADLLKEWLDALTRARVYGGDEVGQQAAHAAHLHARALEDNISHLRGTLRIVGSIPPDLPPELTWLDTTDEALKQIARMRNTEVRSDDAGTTKIKFARAPRDEGNDS
ncbi:helix-turn-helix domain-containing protein [Embleya sp. NPDC059259]|uniref:helix-turn-helix domain-containing protein n=1 Tax=unclassified Embleya TaxID=2699296 RepID=UPI0036BE08BB